ncbi:hypothetical protein [Neotabrizicola sp. VNH66]|uniref:hypothetical protein n=1 Tax=Neotabrizicola sp. VNH66 TaxID=3400918 RepID=UPI003C0C95AD
MARLRIVPVTLVAALAAATALPALAQDSAPPAPRAKTAELRVDFGGGRKVAIDCGDAALEACIAAATPLIDKVAATPVVEGKGGFHGKGERGHGKGHGKGDGKRGGMDTPPPPAPPAEEGAVPPVPPEGTPAP